MLTLSRAALGVSPSSADLDCGTIASGIHPAESGPKMTEATNSGGPFSYSDYLRLDKGLAAQEPRSSAHDELLFIIQHQTSELWMKLAIHELNATCRQIADDNLQPAFKMLSRISRIFEQLNSAWDVLRTMTPSEYTRFREELEQSSGFSVLPVSHDRISGRQQEPGK